MRGNSAPLRLFSSVLAVLMLAGCVTTPIHLDPLSVEGRDGGGPIPTYAMLMRIGAAAQSGGDLPNALGVYRRAAELAPQDPAPLIAAGDVLVQMGNINEAIVSYNAALVRPGDSQGAQVGLARAFLKTGKPQLALTPLSKAMEQSPDDPKLLLLLGVTKDLAGSHLEAQAHYRDGLVRAPGDPGLTVNLALSLALSGSYPNAIAVLQPLAISPAGSAGSISTTRRWSRTWPITNHSANSRPKPAPRQSCLGAPRGLRRNQARWCPAPGPSAVTEKPAI